MVTVQLGRTFEGAGLTTPDAGAALRSLAVALHDAGFDERSAAATAGAPRPEQLLSNPARYAFFGARSRPEPPFAALTSLFVLNRDVPAAWVSQATGPRLVDQLMDLSLLVRDGDDVRGTISITPWQGQYFLSDQLFRNPAPQRIEPVHGDDVVMPPHASSLLALPAVADLAGSFLDVGCGTGFLALNARRAGRTAGFDLNPRCVQFATGNAAFNGSDARFSVADFATLELDEPDRFHHMLFNAPTQLSEEDGLAEFGRMTTEWVLKRTAEVAHRAVRPGGTASVLGLVEVPQRFGCATDAVHHWLDGRFAQPVTVAELDTPMLTITRRQLAAGRLHGESLLVYGQGQARRLIDSLVARGVAEVTPVLVTMPVTKGG